MGLKTYVLREHTHSSAPHYQRVNAEQRVRFQKRPNDSAYLQITFYDNKTKKNRTARYKANSDSPWLDEQIKEGIPANERFTTAERNAVKFKDGTLMTANERLQNYLEIIPQCEGVDAECPDVREPLYRVYDETVEIKGKNDLFKKRLKAANRIAELTDLEEAQNLMIRLNGTYFKTPDTIEEVQNQLVDFLDDADEAMLEKLIEGTVSRDEEIMILVGRAVDADVLSFTKKDNQVSIKKGSNWVDVKMISSEIDGYERQRLFIEYLASTDGEALLSDLKNKMGVTEKTKNKKLQTA